MCDCPNESLNLSKPLPIVLVSAAALIDPDGRILIAQRPADKKMPGLWEFPGGKVQDGELPEVALTRELQEELALEICPSCFTPFAFASHSYDDFHLLMPLYISRKWKGVPRPQEGQTVKWVRPPELRNYPMPPADTPLISQLQDFL